MRDDGFGGSVPQQRVQAYQPQAPAGHVAMAGPRNQGLKFSLIILHQCLNRILVSIVQAKQLLMLTLFAF